MKPSAIVTSLVVGIAAVVGVTSVGVSQVAKPKTAQQGTEAARAEKAPPTRAVRPSATTTGQRPAAMCTSMRRAPASTCSKDTGKVRVKAPHTDVKVDPDKGQVRVRAPYVDLNIRW